MKKNIKKNKVNLEKVLICGISLGWMASTLYLLLILTATITK